MFRDLKRNSTVPQSVAIITTGHSRNITEAKYFNAYFIKKRMDMKHIAANDFSPLNLSCQLKRYIKSFLKEPLKN